MSIGPHAIDRPGCAVRGERVASAVVRRLSGLIATALLFSVAAGAQQYTFSLYTTVNGSRGALLASTTVAISSTLSLDVQPSSPQSLNYNDNLNFTITVRDPSGNLVELAQP